MKRPTAHVPVRYVALIEVSASTAIAGVSTQHALPVTERRIWTNIHTASASTSGGYSQFSAVRLSEPGRGPPERLRWCPW